MYDHVIFYRESPGVYPGAVSDVPVIPKTSPGQINAQLGDIFFRTFFENSKSFVKYMYFGSENLSSQMLLSRWFSVSPGMIMTGNRIGGLVWTGQKSTCTFLDTPVSLPG